MDGDPVYAVPPVVRPEAPILVEPEPPPGQPRLLAPGRREGDPASARGVAPGARPVHTLRWLVIIGLVLILVLGAIWGFNTFRAHAIAKFFAGNKPPPVPITAVTARLAAVPHTASGIGSLEAVHQVTVSPEVAGTVTAIYFQPGATVAAGAPLAQIDDSPDRADLANYEAQVHLATIELKRSQALLKNQYATQETADQNASTLQQAEAEVQKTQALIAQKLIRAPFAGKLGVRQINLGQYLNAGAAIVSLTDLSQLYVNFTLPSQLRATIAVGQPVDVAADAFPGRVFKARITTISPQVSADTRTLTVQATMANPGDALLPGMFINATVLLPAGPDAVVVPSTAVDYTLYGDSVYVIRAQGHDAAGKPILHAVRVPVETGLRWGNNVAVTSGLKAGDEVVAAGQVKVQSGSVVLVTGAPPPTPPVHPTLE
jgi:multidrug efflux system membrane fusion protein